MSVTSFIYWYGRWHSSSTSCMWQPGWISRESWWVKEKKERKKEKNRRRKWQSTLVFLPGRYHGQKSLEGCSPWVHMTEHTRMRGVEEEGLVAINRGRTKRKKKKGYILCNFISIQYSWNCKIVEIEDQLPIRGCWDLRRSWKGSRCGYELATWGILQWWRCYRSWLYQCHYPGCDCTPQFFKMLPFFKLGYSCFTYNALFSAVQGSESAMCIHIHMSLTGPPSQPFRSSQSMELSSRGLQ